MLIAVSYVWFLDIVVIISFEFVMFFLVIFSRKLNVWIPLSLIFILNLWLKRYNRIISRNILVVMNCLRALNILIGVVFHMLSRMHHRTSLFNKWIFHWLIIIWRILIAKWVHAWIVHDKTLLSRLINCIVIAVYCLGMLRWFCIDVRETWLFWNVLMGIVWRPHHHSSLSLFMIWVKGWLYLNFLWRFLFLFIQ